ncbi:MAG: UDP-N-acetylmuramate dehydrogenase, partial [Deltaproteobacteria bacterium]|nr:UDP-N-acetylmuramate dehydrogenase [Deltaproteobacteria bacterium]
MYEAAVERLRAEVRGRVLLGAPLADLTTLRVGGPAQVLVYPADRDDLARALVILRDTATPVFVLGRGSNLVVRDAGIRGAVVCLEDGFRTVERLDAEDGSVLVRAEGGAALSRLTRWTVEEAVGGFEALAGIPGTVGGAVAMNAGAWGVELADRLVSVELMGPDGETRTLPRDALAFGYRRFDLPAGHVILGAVLRGEPRPAEAVKAELRDVLAKRHGSQPYLQRSAGSVFRNPPGRSAGELIDRCGLKGVRVGDAEISRVHANFIVNTGMATAAHVVALIGMIQERVQLKFRVHLEPEVRVVGDWE